METIKLQITGMACGGCADTVSQALLALEGVAECAVSHGEAQAIVSYDPAKVTPAQMRSAIASAGYQVTG